MPMHKISPVGGLGRKSAYVARNRASLLRAAQQVLSENGPEASIDQFAQRAEIAVSTIYKHFQNKEELIDAAYIEAFRDWQEWVVPILDEIKDPIVELIMPMRIFFRLGKTHPIYAAMFVRNISSTNRHFPQLEEGFARATYELIKAQILTVENPEIRLRSIFACINAGLANQLLNPGAKESDSDVMVEVILGILGLSQAKAKKIAHSPMPSLPTS
jgi:AcrR family transcriptional regulator